MKKSIAILSLVLFVAIYAITFSNLTISNPIAMVKTSEILSIDYTPPIQNSLPVRVSVVKHDEINRMLSSARHERSPAKWQSDGELLITLTDGATADISVYDAFGNHGAFKIDDNYFLFAGTISGLISRNEHDE